MTDIELDDISNHATTLTQNLNHARTIQKRWQAISNAIALLRRDVALFDAPFSEDDALLMERADRVASKNGRDADLWISHNQKILEDMITKLVGS